MKYGPSGILVYAEMEEPPNCQLCGESIGEKEAVSISDYFIDSNCWKDMHAADLADLLGFPVFDIQINTKTVYEVLPKGNDDSGEQTDASNHYS